MDGSHKCDSRATCTDTRTSYECKCQSGLSGNGFQNGDAFARMQTKTLGCFVDPFATTTPTEATTTTKTTTTTTTTIATTTTTKTTTPATTTPTTTTTTATTTTTPHDYSWWCAREGEISPPEWLFPWPKISRCQYPTCEAEITIIDSWKKLKSRKNREAYVYGWSALIKVPAVHYDKDGFSILIRLPAELERGSFQVWNMNFWNFYRGHNDGFEVLLHSKHWTAGDTTDIHSFLIVAERLSTPELRTL